MLRSRVDVDVDEDTDVSAAIRLSCEDFRQGRVWEGELFLELDPDAGSPADLSLEVTATNAPGVKQAGLEVPFAVESAKTEDLISFTDMQLKRTMPQADWLASVPREGFDDRVNWGRFKF